MEILRGIGSRWDESKELTKKPTLGVLVIHLVGSHGIREERPTWSMRGSVMRLKDFKEE